MASLMPLGKQQYFSASGAPLVGGKVYTYAAGTTSALATYSDKAGVTPNTNPVILDSRGEATIFWGQAGYKVVLKDSADVTIWTQDNLYAVQDSSSMTFAQELITATAGQTVFNLSISYTNGTNSIAVYCNGLRLPPTDYTETSTTSVTMNTGATVGDEFLFVAGDFAASTTGADLVTYTPAGTGAIATTVQSKLRESVSVKDFGAVGDGVTDDYAEITAAITYLSVLGGGILLFPRGTYVHSSPLIFKNNIIYRGEGQNNITTLQYSGTSDQIQINNPKNTTTPAYIVVEDMDFYSTVTTSKKANFADTSSTYLEITRCNFLGNDYGVILDQTELAIVQECVFGSHTNGSIWLVNGTARDGSGATYYTNRITIRNNQFNEGATCDEVVDDGGYVHVIENNNFNAGAIQIRAAGAKNIRITGNEMEGSSIHAIAFSQTQKYGGVIGVGNAAVIENNFIIGATTAIAPHNSTIDFDTGCLGDLVMNANLFNQNIGGAIPTTDPRSYVSLISAQNNTNLGTMTANVPFNNFNQDTAWTPVIGGSSTLGGATYTSQKGRYIQNGNQHYFELEVIWTALTGGAAGQMYVSMPKAVIQNGPQFVTVTCSGAVTLAANEQLVAIINCTNTAFGTAGTIQLYKQALGVLSSFSIPASGTVYISGNFVGK